MTRLQFLLVLLGITIIFAVVSSLDFAPPTPEEQAKETLYSYVQAYKSRDFKKYCSMVYVKDLPAKPGSGRPDVQDCINTQQASNHPIDSRFFNEFLDRLDRAKVVSGGPTQGGAHNNWAEISIQPFDWQSFEHQGSTYMIQTGGKWYIARSLYYSNVLNADGSYAPISQPQFATN